MTLQRVLKPLALVSAVVLVGAYVAYRAGVFDGLLAPVEPPSAGGSEAHPNYLSGSKSTFMFVGNEIKPPAEPVAPPPAPAFLGGSKSAPMFGVPTGITPAGQSTPPRDPPKAGDDNEDIFITPQPAKPKN